MPEPTWPAEALLLIAHGATRHANAARVVQAHAAGLRQRACFAEVAVGLLNGTPSPVQALAKLTSRVVHVVPFFMERGWFVREAVPRSLQECSGHDLRFHDPVGLHPGLATVAAARVHAAIGPDAAHYAVLLVGHGSARTPGRPTALRGHATSLAARGAFAQVRAAFLEEPPFVPDALRAWRMLPVAVIGFFAGEGGHVRDDLPALLAAERMRRGEVPVLDLGIVGDDPAMPRIILEQVAAPSSSPGAG